MSDFFQRESWPADDSATSFKSPLSLSRGVAPSHPSYEPTKSHVKRTEPVYEELAYKAQIQKQISAKQLNILLSKDITLTSAYLNEAEPETSHNRQAEAMEVYRAMLDKQFVSPPSSPPSSSSSSSLYSHQPRIFAIDQDKSGRKSYAVMPYGRFVHKYFRKLTSVGRHYYELIPEDSPCRLYFDLEVSGGERSGETRLVETNPLNSASLGAVLQVVEPFHIGGKFRKDSTGTEASDSRGARRLLLLRKQQKQPNPPRVSGAESSDGSCYG